MSEHRVIFLRRGGPTTLILLATLIAATGIACSQPDEPSQRLRPNFSEGNEDYVGPDFSVIAFSFNGFEEYTACAKNGATLTGPFGLYMKPENKWGTPDTVSYEDSKYDSLNITTKQAGFGTCSHAYYDAGFIWVEMDEPFGNGIGHVDASGFDSIVVHHPPTNHAMALRPVLEPNGACPSPHIMSWEVRDANGSLVVNESTNQETLIREGTSTGRTYFASFQCRSDGGWGEQLRAPAARQTTRAPLQKGKAVTIR